MFVLFCIAAIAYLLLMEKRQVDFVLATVVWEVRVMIMMCTSNYSKQGVNNKTGVIVYQLINKFDLAILNGNLKGNAYGELTYFNQREMTVFDW